MLNINIFLIVTLLVGVCTSESNNSDLLQSEVVINHSNSRSTRALILTDCGESNETIVVIDDSGKLDFMWLQKLHQQFYSILLLKGQFLKETTHFDYKKIDAIFISMSTYRNLTITLNHFHRTLWWSSMIPIYVLHLPIDGCDSKSAFEILHLVWKKKILTSYYFCGIKTVQVYTYNPFIDQAPSVWKKVQSKKNWTLYQQYFYSVNNCEGFQFDRTQNLNGFLLNIYNEKPFLTETFKRRGKILRKYIAYRTSIILNILSTSLHIKYKLRAEKEVSAALDPRECTSYRHKKLYVKNSNKNRGIMPDLIMDNSYLHVMTRAFNCVYVRTYPLAWYEDGIAVKHRGYRTIGEKLWGFYGIWAILFTIFTLITTFIVVWFTHNRNTAFATFEVIRLLISHNLHTPMNTLFLRIFFLSVLIYFLIIQATFNGHLAKFLTELEPRRHPETEKDLEDLGYKSIQDGKNYFSFWNSNQDSLLWLMSRWCMEHELNNDVTACVYDHTFQIRYQQKLRTHTQVHISKKPIRTKYAGFRIDKYHPLVNRVNRALMSLEDFGFRQWVSKYAQTLEENTSIKIEAESEDYFLPINLEHLMFGFWILAIGLGSAACSFCVEMLIGHKESLLDLLEVIEKRCIRTLRRIRIRCKFRR